MITIRQFQPEDMFTVIKLAYNTLPERYNPTAFNHLYELFPHSFLIAEEHHKIVGFIAGSHITKTKARILLLSVQQKYRGKGIGSALLEAFMNKMQELQISEIELEVKTTNKAAITFYQKHEFTITETIKEFYQDNTDAYIMTRII